MKKSLTLFAFLFGWQVIAVQAGTKQPYQSATVVSVANHQGSAGSAGDNPSDSPLPSTIYSYDIGIRLNCTVYVVRYETGMDYLPSVFTPHHSVEVNPQKHVMYVNVPGEREMRLGIAARSHATDSSCIANN